MEDKLQCSRPVQHGKADSVSNLYGLTHSPRRTDHVNGCNKFSKVVSGDSCYNIAQAAGIVEIDNRLLGEHRKKVSIVLLYRLTEPVGNFTEIYTVGQQKFRSVRFFDTLLPTAHNLQYIIIYIIVV